MIVYLVMNNNHKSDEDFEQWSEWVDGIFSTEEEALARAKVLVLEDRNYLSKCYDKETAQEKYKEHLQDTPIYVYKWIVDTNQPYMYMPIDWKKKQYDTNRQKVYAS